MSKPTKKPNTAPRSVRTARTTTVGTPRIAIIGLPDEQARELAQYLEGALVAPRGTPTARRKR